PPLQGAIAWWAPPWQKTVLEGGRWRGPYSDVRQSIYILRFSNFIGRMLDEIANISASFPNVTRRAVGIKHAMAGYHGIRMQSLNLIERAQPLVSGLFIALGEIGMRVVIDGVARYDQGNRRNVQRR